MQRAPVLQTETPRGLGPFFWLASRAPGLMRALGPLARRVVPLVSEAVRKNTRLNATRIFGRELTPREQCAFTGDVVESFYQFIADVGWSGRATVDQVRSRIERVEGEPEYKAVRQTGRGAVLVTAHMGSFEVGLAALAQSERRVHVVYKRDASGPFEAMRARMRRMLNVVEAPIDDGLSTWMDLRQALLDNHVVVMQADRAMPGQRSAVVPFLSGHLRVPTGAVRLARLTGSLLVPVFTVRLPSGGFAVHLLGAIEPGDGASVAGPRDPAVIAVSMAIESMVAAYPTQWLVLGRAFEEDAAHV
ncbi:MAG: lysophospholipid acyltransferase family protein [Phycisphaerales bacterium]